MSLLFDTLYLSAGVAGAPVWLYKLCRSRKMRQVVRGKFTPVQAVEKSDPAVWLHCASVGEVLLARGLVAGMPDFRPLISYNTPAAVETARKHFPDATRFYSPADLSCCVSRALDRLQPALLVLMELELWPNLVLLARKRNIPVAVVNGRISRRAAKRYRLVRRLLKPVLNAVDVFAMQSEEYAERIIGLGAAEQRVAVTGSMKYDNVSTDEAPDAEMGRILKIEPGRPVIVGGCTYQGEDEALIDAYSNLLGSYPGLKLILAPRHPERLDAVEAAVTAAGLRCVRRSSLDISRESDEGIRDAVVLVDTVGELEAIYSLGTVAFVGGSLIPRGGHNIIEPSGRGIPVLVGPHTENFSDAVSEVARAGGLETVRETRDIQPAIEALMSNPQKAGDMGRRAMGVVLHHKGATQRTIDLLASLVARCE